MNTTELEKHFIYKYLKQKHSLPKAARELLEKDEKIELYGLFDLNENLHFEEQWILLTKDKAYLIEKKETEERYRMRNHFEISKVSRIQEIQSLSCTTFIFVSSDDMPPLATIRFTGRQKIIMGHIKYFTQQRIEKAKEKLERTFDPDKEYVKAILQPVQDAQNSTATKQSQTFWRLLSYLAPYKKELSIGTVGAVMATIVSLIPAYLSGYLIDHIIRPFQDGSLSMEEAGSLAWIMVASIAAVRLVKEFFIWLRLNKMSVLGEYVARDLRKELYAHLQKLSLDFYSKKQTGSIISRVSSDTDRLWDFIAFGVVEVGISLITLVGLSCVLIYLDWRLGLLMTIPVPLLLFSIFKHGEHMKKLFLKAWRKWSDLTAVLSDTIPGIQVVKAFNQEEKEVGRFNERNGIIMDEFNNIHQSWTRFWPALMIGMHLIIIAVWFFATPRLISPEGEAGHLTAGTFVSFLLYMTMFTAPIEVVGQVARMLNRALSSAHRIFEVLDTNPTIVESKNPIALKEVKGDVEFQNVFFSYDGIRSILKGLSFKVKAGEMIGLVGTSGGGKSTITKLIARFFDIDGGKILIDGQDLKDLEIGLFRKQVGMVLQEPYLFHGSILANISYGADNVSTEDVVEAAKIANAHNFIGKLPYGYDTIVGERGHTLSGGERQRISIARAILHNPRILILDEATSAVDTETERNIQEALDRLIEGRTVFAIAHRLSTLRKADRIFVIDNGTIKEQGTHKELLEKEDGAYRKLHKMQQEMSEFFAL